jgi:hypothetical protein
MRCLRRFLRQLIGVRCKAARRRGEGASGERGGEVVLLLLDAKAAQRIRYRWHMGVAKSSAARSDGDKQLGARSGRKPTGTGRRQRGQLPAWHEHARHLGCWLGGHGRFQTVATGTGLGPRPN